MSQKKVDAYKQEKANRSKIIKKEKRMLFLEKAVALLVSLVLVFWIGFSVYNKVTENPSFETVSRELVTSALDDYLNTLSAGSEEEIELDEEETVEDEDLETVEEEAVEEEVIEEEAAEEELEETSEEVAEETAQIDEAAQEDAGEEAQAQEEAAADDAAEAAE